MTDPNNEGPVPGWYRDPARDTGLRWWDGRAWTAHVRELEEPAPASAQTESAHTNAASGSWAGASAAGGAAHTSAAGAPGLVIPVESSSTVMTSADDTATSVPESGKTEPPALHLGGVESEPEPEPDPVAEPLAEPEPTPEPLIEPDLPVSGEAVPALAGENAETTIASQADSGAILPPGTDAFALMAAATGSIKVIDEDAVSAAESTPEPAPKPRRRGLGIAIGLAVAALVVIGAIVFIVLDPLGIFVPGPGYAAQVEDALVASIEAESGLGVTEVVCPDTLTANTAAPFDCTVTFDDASTLPITATITDGGQTVQWSPAN